jgi:hypothetical protein
MPPRGNKRINQEQVEIFKAVHALFWDAGVGIRGVTDADMSITDQQTIGLHGGMVHREEGDLKSACAKRPEGVFAVNREPHESEDLSTISDDTGATIYLRRVLHPVKFTKTHEMIVMAMSPDHTVNPGRTADEELLAEIRGSLDKDILLPLLDEERSPQPLDTG